MKIGVICFDEYRYLSEGWASVDGSPSERVNGVNELSSGVIWITNLHYKSYRSHNLVQAPNIFDHQYFRTSIKLIAEEHGIQNNPKLIAQFCSEVFSRLIRQAQELFELDMSHMGYRFSSLLSDYLLPGSAKKAPTGVNSTVLKNIFREANQANQAMLGNRPFGSASVNLTIPRANYVKWIISQPVPDSNEWKEKHFQKGQEKIIGVRDGVEIKGTKSVLSKLQSMHDENQAAFYKVSILSSDSDRKLFQSFGNGSSYLRNWVSLPELIYLATYNEIKVSESVVSSLSKLDLADSLCAEVTEYSYSRGLLLENVLAALCSTTGPTRSETALSAYLRAYDRIVCGKLAKFLFDDGFTVGSYGMGKIIAYCRKNERERLKESAEKVGLMYPLDL